MKRIRVISLAVIAALSLTVTSFAAEKSPQQSAAAYLSEAGIMLGNESGDMMLEQGLTRAQMAALLTRIVTDPEQFETDSAFYRSLCSFTDVPEWAKSYVGYCVANNLVAGYGNGRYGSNDPVTSAAACTVMLRCLNDVDAVWDYLARVTPIEDPDYSCAPFITEDESEVRGSRTSDLEGLADGKPSAACQEPQNLLSKNREDRASRTAKSAFPEPQKLTPSKKEKRKIDQSHMEVRPSVRAPAQDGRTDGDAEEELLDILDGCELECFAPETALVFENAIERLFYADSFRIGNATLPQSRVRAKLRRLDGMILREAESKLRANQERNVKNSTAYTMAVLFNCIAESESDLMIDPYLNAICAAV